MEHEEKQELAIIAANRAFTQSVPALFIEQEPTKGYKALDKFVEEQMGSESEQYAFIYAGEYKRLLNEFFTKSLEEKEEMKEKAIAIMAFETFELLSLIVGKEVMMKSLRDMMDEAVGTEKEIFTKELFRLFKESFDKKDDEEKQADDFLQSVKDILK